MALGRVPTLLYTDCRFLAVLHEICSASCLHLGIHASPITINPRPYTLHDKPQCSQFHHYTRPIIRPPPTPRPYPTH